MKRIDFTKMHGLGNDYIYVNTDLFPIDDPAAFSIKWSKQHTGIGSDGLIMICRSDVADFQMRIFNNDGTEAMMCGNGSRCVGKYVYDHRLTDKTEIALDTLSGIKHITLHKQADGEVNSATVEMGEPLLANKQQVATEDGTLAGVKLITDSLQGCTFSLSQSGNSNSTDDATYVCMGNPHCVIFVDDIADVNLEIVGKQLEFNPVFPERANIEFVQVLPDGVLRMRVWERGSGITQACGTGACATAVAACITGRAGRESTVRMDGGELTIRWGEDNHIYMTGPAETAFEGYVMM